MKKGTIFKNTFCNYECYFVYHGPAHTAKYEANAVSGYELLKFNNSDHWELKKGRYYIDTLKDEEHFPIIGYLDIDALIKTMLIQKVTEYENERNGIRS